MSEASGLTLDKSYYFSTELQKITSFLDLITKRPSSTVYFTQNNHVRRQGRLVPRFPDLPTLTVWDTISQSHGIASKSHGGPENLEIAKNSVKCEETSNNQFIIAELIKLVCEKTWVHCQFQ